MFSSVRAGFGGVFQLIVSCGFQAKCQIHTASQYTTLSSSLKIPLLHSAMPLTGGTLWFKDSKSGNLFTVYLCLMMSRDVVEGGHNNKLFS